MYKLTLILALSLSLFTISCATSNHHGNIHGERTVSATNDPIRDLMYALDGTQWTGTAIPHDLSAKLDSKALSALAIVLKNKLKSDDANMAFQLFDGRLFYLSDIFASDKKVEERAMGICDYSPPREAVFTIDDSGNITGDIVLPERFRDEKTQVLSEVGYYKAPLISVGLTNSNTKLDFVAKPFTSIELPKFKGKPLEKVEVTYAMNKVPSQKTAELAEKLRLCLKHKPWMSKK